MNVNEMSDFNKPAWMIRVVVFVLHVTQTVEVESADSLRALAEMQTKNGALQEQLSVQRQLLRELETQLHESQRACAQLRTQVTSAATCLLHVCFLSRPQTTKPESHRNLQPTARS